MMVTKLIFWFFIVLMAHSYVLYPLLLQLIIRLRGSNKYSTYSNSDELPSVSILMAAYNEEAVIEKKIESIFQTTYPLPKIQLLVGSDSSTDKTNEIIQRLALKYTSIEFTNFTARSGKIRIINQLYEHANGDIIFITDANVLFEPKTIFETVKFFKDERVGLVDTNMQNYGLKKDGISFQEKSYISREVKIKQLESLAGGSMIGPFGGCYSLRKELFEKVPYNYLVDDFFVCMNVLQKGKAAINSIEAKVNEDVSNNLSIEFNRKIRIAAGNFQNLAHFRKMLWPPYKTVSFYLLSHKVLRWLGPFFLIGILASNIVLAFNFQFYYYLLILQLTITFLPIADTILKKFGIHMVFLRFASHFYTMNLSLLIGFIKFLKGIETNVWKPTKRFQK